MTSVVANPAVLCSIAGCSSVVNSLGFCGAHYWRHRNGRDMEAPIRGRRKSPNCSMDNCDEPVKTSGLCKFHYYRTRSEIPVDAPRLRVARYGAEEACSVNLCDTRPEALAMCMFHYVRFAKGSTVEGPRLRNPVDRRGECFIAGCDVVVDSVMMCARHSGRAGRFGLSCVQLQAIILREHCDLCGIPFVGDGADRNIDHDHACCPGKRSCGKCVRGVLCSGCNIGLGAFVDSPDRLRGAIAYLAPNLTVS